MNITITGASGFLGQKLAHGLLSANALTDSAGSPSRVEHLTLLDVVNPSKELSNDPRVTILTGGYYRPFAFGEGYFCFNG